MTEHHFTPLHMDGSVTAACTCGWVSAYGHAFVEYAEHDWAFHAEQAEEAVFERWGPT